MSKSKHVEIEGKILDVNLVKFKSRLKNIGATKVDDYYFKRYVFDVVPASSSKWVRLRTDGRKSTLTVKMISNDSVEGTKEWETEVADFEEALLILSEMGLKHHGYQENKRSLYLFEGAEISIDEWPQIPPYVEIEANTAKEVFMIAKKLGYNKGSVTGLNTQKVYEHYGMDLRSIEILKF